MLNQTSNSNPAQPAAPDRKESWVFSPKTINRLLGLIILLLGLIGSFNYGAFGQFISYCLVYVFGCFVFPVLASLIGLGLFLIISGHWPRMRMNFTGLGYILIMLFGALASSLAVEGLGLSNFGEKFTEAINSITGSAFTIPSLMESPKVCGGFLGYLCASLFLTGLGKIGAYIFCYLFLFIGTVLIMRIPTIRVFEDTRDFVARRNAHRKNTAGKEEAKPAAPQEAAKAPTTPNPFKESAYEGPKAAPAPVPAPAPASSPKENDDDMETLFGMPRKEVTRDANPSGISQDHPSPSPFSGTSNPVSASPFQEASPSPEKPKIIVKSFYPDEDAQDSKVIAEASPFSAPEPAPSAPEEEKPLPAEPLKPAEVPDVPPVQRTFTVPPPQPVSQPEPAPVIEKPAPAPEEKKASQPSPSPKAAPSIVLNAPEKDEDPIIKQPAEKIYRYPLPSINLLTEMHDLGKFEQNTRAAEAKIPVINGVYQKLGIGASVQSFTIGPSVTRFNIVRQPGVKVSQISSNDVEEEMKIDLQGDMSVRLVSVVKGMDTSGVEIGNIAPTMVSFRDCFGAVLKKGTDKLLVPLGEDISSEVLTVSLDELPHLLIAGTTGSGKSVFIHSLIMTLIMRNYPDELKLILVDPKQVEFVRYADLPHLFCPIITNVTYAVAMLKRLVSEMERRYTVLSRYLCSNIHDYNKLKKNDPSMENMPNIVCIIDEFADMMGQDPRNVDALTQRLAQKARAAGIYLIISTQRPSVNCITGTIKANIPARIALLLPSFVDSKTILDEGGAETLLGKGDLLAHIPSLRATIRLQSAFASDAEIGAVTDYLKQQAKPSYNQAFVNFNLPPDGAENEDQLNDSQGHRSSGFEDDLYSQVKDYVLSTKIASTSGLERHYGIGYGRAASLLDALEEEGIIRTVMPGNRKEVVVPGGEEKHDDGTGSANV
jgi:S-DNA-T family DNA segregation ATPase FtsK/SpoIIIE